MFTFNPSQLPHRQMVSGRTAEPLAQDCDLSELAGLSGMHVHHAILAPGHRASAPHWHSHTEEMVVVLTGSLVLHQGTDTRTLQAGEVALFPAHRPEAHYLANPTSEPATFLSIATPDSADRVHYTLTL
jgi:uncharacterized cupin superfamily protein